MKTTWTRDAEQNLAQNDDVVGSKDTCAIISEFLTYGEKHYVKLLFC